MTVLEATPAQTPATNKGFSIEREGDLAIVWFDLPGEKVNKFSSTVIQEFAAIIDELEKSDAKGIVLASRKPGIFIAGADGREFMKATTVEQAKEYTRYGNELFHRFSKLPQTKVA